MNNFRLYRISIVVLVIGVSIIVSLNYGSPSGLIYFGTVLILIFLFAEYFE